VSEESVEVIRLQFEATNAGDFERAMGFYAKEVVLVVDGFGFLDGTFEGREAVGGWFGGWFASFERGYHFDLDDMRDLGDGRVFFVASHGGRGRGSGIEVGAENSYIYTVGDGMIVRMELFSNSEEAFAAAGLSE
jgi:ketosteroid isomerase-like protein